MNAQTSAAPASRTGLATAATWMTAATAAPVASASAGLWVQSLYQDSPAVEAMFRGYDLVTLVVVAPLLAATLLRPFRDRPGLLLVRTSLLAYCVYNYAYYLFGAELNAALLLHVAIFAASLYALVLSLMDADVAVLASRFRSGTPVRPVAVILLLLGVPLAAIQVLGLLGFALAGAVPDEPSHLVVPLTFTRLGAVLDLSLLVPAYLLAAVLLWRRRAWGYVLGTVVLVAGTLHQLSYVTGILFQITADIPGAAFDPFEPLILGLFAIGSGLLLASLRLVKPEAPSATHRRAPAEPHLATSNPPTR